MTARAVARVYPRLMVGGAETDILQLLRAIPDTHMIVYAAEGLAAQEARRIAARYTFVGRPRLPALIEALRGAAVVHLHTINDFLLAPLAAQLAGPRAIVQTLHNRIPTDTPHFVDVSIVRSEEQRFDLPTPTRAEVIGRGIATPAAPPARAPWAGRPVRLLEIRRPDKQMRFTLEALLATGALDTVDLGAQVVGVSGGSGTPRLLNVGERIDPSTEIGEADLLVHASAVDNYGGTLFEAMAFGAIPIATPLAPFRQAADEGAHVFFLSSADARAAAVELRAIIDRLAADPALVDRARHENHAYVTARHGVAQAVARTEGLYRRLLAAAPARRSFGPADWEDGPPGPFLEMLEAQIESARPPELDAAQVLGPRQRGVYLWCAARQAGLAPAQQAALLEASATLLGPDRLVVCLDLGFALADAGRPAEAAAWFERALALEPDDLPAALGRIRCRVELGDLRGALGLAEALATRFPGSGHARDVQASLRRASGG